MPSIPKACAALLGTAAAAHALPASASAPLYFNSSSPVPPEQREPACSSAACSGARDRNASRPLASTFAPTQARNQTGLVGTQANASAVDAHPWTTSLHATPVLSPTPTTLDRGSSSTGEATRSPTSSGPQSTLLPQVHWTFDTRPAENVKPILPGQASQMFYGNSGKPALLGANGGWLTRVDPAKAGAFAFISYYFTSHSVNLDHSDHVSVSSAGADNLVVNFRSREAFEHASATWSAEEGLILMAYVKGCGEYEKGQRCYFDVSSLKVHASGSIRTIVARGQAKHPDDISSGGDTEWGWWSPRDDNGAASSHGETGSGPGFSWNAGPTPNPGSGSGSGANGPSGRTRCAAPPDAEHGLPTACLGEYFDLDLDDGLGYEPLSNKSRAFLREVAPGVGLGGSPSSYHGSNETTAWRRRQRRTLSDKESFWSKALRTVKTVFADAYSAVADLAKIGGAYEKELSWALPDPDKPGSESNKLVDGDAREVVSPWGKAVLLKSFGSQEAEHGLTKYLNVFCVDCGTRGKASVAGKASWSLLHGITEGRLEINADMRVALKLGIDAQISFKSDFSTELLRVGLPGLTYGSVTVAPQMSVGSRVGLEAAAKGRLLAGAEMGLQASRVVVDLVDPSKNEQTGWEPYLRPVLEAEGAVMLSASLALPVGLECGLAISQWHKTVSLVSEPSIKAIAQAAVAIGLPDGSFSSGFRERDGCTGVSSQVSWRNKVSIDVLGMKAVSLHDTGDRDLARNCFALPAYKEATNATRPASKRSAQPVSDVTSEYAAHGSRYVTSTPAALEASSYSEVNGLSYSRLVTPGEKAMVVSCSNGNLYAARAEGERGPDCSDLFPIGRDGAIASDGGRRLMHYDATTMSKLGVSRLRLRADHDVTRAGAAVVLGLYTDASASYYLGVDADGNVLYPTVCDFTDASASKVFLASHPERGLRTLESEHVKHSITGGAVDKCYPLLVSGGASAHRRV